MGASGDMVANLVQTKLHGLGVCIGQDKRSAGSPARTNRAKQIGLRVALVGGRAWTRNPPGPNPHLIVLLGDRSIRRAKMGPIHVCFPVSFLEPYLHALAFAHATQTGLERASEGI